MTFSVELVATPTAEIARNILKNVDEVVDVYFTKTKILDEIGWCSSYMLDKEFHLVYLTELSWLNILPNCKIHKKLGEQYDLFFFIYVLVSVVNRC